MKNPEFLLELFDSQSITAEKLPHNPSVLGKIGAIYRQRNIDNEDKFVTDMAILAFLLDARKSGLTARKSDREKKSKEETFGEIQESWGTNSPKMRWYDITATHHIELSDIIKIIFVALIDKEPLPVTRQQVFLYLKQYIPMRYHTDDDMNMSEPEGEMWEQAEKRAKHLFPELITDGI